MNNMRVNGLGQGARHLLGIFVTLVGLSACGPTFDDGLLPQAKQDSPKAQVTDTRNLLQRDLADMARLQTTQVDDFDSANHHAFTEIFGGSTGTDVMAYFNQRIHYYFVDGEDTLTANVDLDRLPYQGWLRSVGSTPAASDVVTPLADNPNVQLGGQNIGTEFWFMALVNSTPITLYLNNTAIPMTSPRTGIMRFGAAYAATMDLQNGHTITMPAGFRQGILVHEARHSDCTGGVTQSDLNVARAVKSQDEFTQKFPKMECGHFHSICPPEMKDFAGLPACDDRPWGAYSVGYIYQAALAKSAPEGSLDKAVLEATALDSFSRLRFNTDAMLSGADGPPDMSSGNLNVQVEQ